MISKQDRWIIQFDQALRTILGVTVAHEASPADSLSITPELDGPNRLHSAALMRVNHVGEVCAQALYQAQTCVTKDPLLKAYFSQAAKEEENHLAWTRSRVHDLGSHLSWLNPCWYAGAFLIGVSAAKVNDRVSLGFVVETERQVEAHLTKHLTLLPDEDTPSRAIVLKMREDEMKHAHQAQALGAIELPGAVKGMMKAMAKVMTRVAYYI